MKYPLKFFLTLICTLLPIVLISAQETPLPIETGYIPTSGDALIYYEACGQGEPIILLHGHSLDLRMWDLQYEEFAKEYRVIRFDFRGYGRSSDQNEYFQFTHVDDLITVMDSLFISKAHIVGLSMGAFVASDLLAISPERIISCILASGGMKTYKGPSEPMDMSERRKRDKEIEALKEKGVETMKREWIESLIASGGSCRETMRTPLEMMVNDWSAWQPLHKEVRVIMAHDAEIIFKEKRPLTPTLIIEGGSPTNRHNSHPWMLDYLPNGSYLLLPDCGHMMNMEQPEIFNKTVLDFIKNHNE